ncbi:MAG: 50S ribosomal protein L6 [Minisyncoccia bacterium]
MSRLAKKPIIVPAGTTVTLQGQNISVKGKGGELKRVLSRFVKAEQNGSEITITAIGNSTQSSASSGTEVAHIRNMIAGVNTPFVKKLIIEGIGYRTAVAGKKMNFNIGKSHPVEMAIPADLTVTVEKSEITISGISRDAVGQFAANVRALKKPEPYKGKGIRYSDEVIRRKQGKRAA